MGGACDFEFNHELFADPYGIEVASKPSDIVPAEEEQES
jgi:hypothetical protein